MKKRMTAKQLANLKPVRKGDPGRNPLGAGAHNPALRALKNLTTEIYVEIIKLALTSNIEALERVEEDPKSAAVQVGVARCLRMALIRGDWMIVNSIAERLVGKVPEKHEVKTIVENPTREGMKQIIDERKSRV